MYCMYIQRDQGSGSGFQLEVLQRPECRAWRCDCTHLLEGSGIGGWKFHKSMANESTVSTNAYKPQRIMCP